MIAAAFLIVLAAYLACGLVFTMPFVFHGVEKIDPHATHGELGFPVVDHSRHDGLLAAIIAAMVVRISRAAG